jgi:hypothetical protein
MREVERLRLVDFSHTKMVLNSSIIRLFTDGAGVNPAVILLPKPLSGEKTA